MVELCRYLLIVAFTVSLMGDVMSVNDEEFQVQNRIFHFILLLAIIARYGFPVKE